MRPKPAEPDKEDCCNSGCNPCIFDVYEKELARYEQSLHNPTYCFIETVNTISLLEYTTFKVVLNINLCESHQLIVFKNIDFNENCKVWWKPGDHFLYKHVTDNNAFTRAYTPIILHNVDQNCVDFDFMIIVKNYYKSVSSFLCSLNVGDETLWRGPYGNFMLNKNYKRILMVGQGTGIAALYPIIKSVIENEDDYTNLVLMYCCHNEKMMLFREELYEINSYWNFNYKIFLSEAVETSKIKYKEPIENHKLIKEDILVYKPFISNDQVLICGSTEFITHFQELFKIEGVNIENIVTF